jgi:hypothetical protein
MALPFQTKWQSHIGTCAFDLKHSHAILGHHDSWPSIEARSSGADQRKHHYV